MANEAERVERGAKLLDKTHPGWENEIDLMKLDLSSPCGCVVGQVGKVSRDGYPSFNEAAIDLGIPPAEGSKCFPDCGPYGFDLGVRPPFWMRERTEEEIKAEYDALQQQWIYQINKRKS